MSDRVLLLAYVASESQALASALNLLADDGKAPRSHALQAQEQSAVASWRFCEEIGKDNLTDPVDRIAEARNYISEHRAEMEAMFDRLVL